MKGWVYIITNKAMPNLIKVGFSTKDPELRALELNNTGNPYPYKVEYDILVYNPRNVEQVAHSLLKNYHENKEWFHCSIEIAITAIREASADEILLENCKFDVFSKKGDIVKPLTSKFIVQNGIAMDTDTGLIWLRFAYGQEWQNDTAVGNLEQVDWKTAFDVVKQFNHQGGYEGCNDWRLPTISELITLIDKAKGKSGNYIDSDVFPNNDYRFWSSSPSTNYSYKAWIVDFCNGCDSFGIKDYYYGARFVRGEYIKTSIN
jgi:hypothetical protein